MFFPMTLKKQVPVEEFVSTLNQRGWSAGRLDIMRTNVPLAPSYVVFVPYEDIRCVVTLACFSNKTGLVNTVKPTVMDLSSFEGSIADNAIGGAIASAGGNLGLIIADRASGMAKKRKKAKQLCKATDVEIKEALTQLGWK